MKTALTSTLFALAWLAAAPAYAQRATTADFEQPGPYPIGSEAREWTDPHRARRVIKVVIRYPKRLGATPLGKRPLIVFSHGLGGSANMYSYFGDHLASHGYFVIHPQHAGSDAEVVRQGGQVALQLATTQIHNYVDRPLDIGYVLDQVSSLRRDPLLRNVDMSKVAVAGHSFGAYTALAAVGQTVTTNGCQLSFRDARIKAALAMSSQGVGTIGLTEQSWRAIRVPVMTMTGSEDYGLGTDDVADRRDAFDGMRPGLKFHLTIKDAEHHAFSDHQRRSLTPRDPRHHGWILAAATAFFRATIEGDQPALEWLQRKQLQRDTNREVVQEQR